MDEYADEGIMLEGAHGPPALMAAAIHGVGKPFKDNNMSMEFLLSRS